MATHPLNFASGLQAGTAELARRIALAREAQPEDVQPPRLGRFVAELSWLAEPFIRPFRRIKVQPAAHPATVMLLPGFGAHPSRMRYLAKHLESAGHRVKRWGLGFNLGITPGKFDVMEQRLLALHARYQVKITLVGWSLGGVFARELAKRHPDKVRRVLTLGSPFSGHPKANNGWRAYHLIAGHHVEDPPIDCTINTKPPVETIAFWSPRDGIVSPRCASGRAGERDRAVALRCTHMGFIRAKGSIETILKELDRA
ncbi:esterase/lipase family protein [Qipengyuania sp.]|uniref:esterase/lipase family protein n=1 Tax=Qipengyuania sp. TaxID=2004515 RepID=UPI0035C79FF0